MEPRDDEALLKELEALRLRVSRMELRHGEELASLKKAIAALEAGLMGGGLRKPTIAEKVAAEMELAKAAKPPPLPFVVEKPATKAGWQEEIDQAEVVPEVVVYEELAAEKRVEEIRVESDGMKELDFGKVWFVRIGVVILLTGLVFLGNYAYQNWVRELSNGARLAALFLCAVAMAETGRRLAKREALNKFGEVVMAGGLGFFYYCVFAAYHVERLEVIDNEVLAAVLLMLAAGGIAAISWFRQAKTTAAIGIVLASYSTMLQPIGWMSSLSNLMLAGAGLFFMTRRGWVAPGVVSMLGTYGAFLGWQILGAAGVGRADVAALWFLPSAWLMFALPGVLDHFRESMGERARAWFTGANNGLFFLLFSALWLDLKGTEHYWLVAGVFGLVLVMLGLAGRSKGALAGGVNVCHGILLISLAMIIKLEGQHLALGLAIQSVTLAAGFVRFKGRSEAVFSIFSGIGAAILLVVGRLNPVLGAGVPLWSAFLTVLLLVVAGFVMRRGIAACREDFKEVVRVGSVALWFAASISLSLACFARFSEPWAMVANMVMAVSFAAGWARLVGWRVRPEVGWLAMWFLAISAIGLAQAEELWGLGLVAVLSILGSCFWSEHVVERKNDEPSLPPELLSWAHAGFVLPALLLLAIEAPIGPEWRVLLLATMGLVFCGAGRWQRLVKFALLGGTFGLVALFFVFAEDFPGDLVWPVFVLAGILAGSFGLLFFGRSGPFDLPTLAAGGILRVSAFAGWGIAWFRLTPEYWVDVIALTAAGLTVLALVTRTKLLAEAVAYLAVASVMLLSQFLSQGWEKFDGGANWQGFAVSPALLLLAFTYRERVSLLPAGVDRKNVINLLAAFGWVFGSLWATQMLVWRADWDGTAVLWTVLGFLAVSAGLWQKLRYLRTVGFACLAIALIKLFAVDVWDFDTFTRVVSFIVLGIALILLGLFYNHFAPVLRRMFEEEK